MAKTAPSEAELKADYSAGVSAKAAKWQRRFLAATGIAEAAKSDAAEASFNASMSVALANKQRQKGLAGISDEDIKRTVRDQGPSIYSTAATAKSLKFAQKAKRFVDAAVDEANKLPPRTADPSANIDARVKPIALRLHALKRGGA